MLVNKLRLNNVPIWNFIDLRKNFSPMEIYFQMEEYIAFANVHCRYLKTKLCDSYDCRYSAEILTKDFWMDVLTCKEKPEVKSPEEYLQYFVDKFCEQQTEGMSDGDRQDVLSIAVQEKEDADVFEKIRYICEKVECSDAEKIILLLAICEIAEMDAREQSFFKETATDESIDDSPKLLSTEDLDPGEGKTIKEKKLVAGPVKHSFYYFDEDELPAGAKIETVKIIAVPSENRYDQLLIELYSKKEDRSVQTITIPSNGYRLCNVCAGRIIKFLPDICIDNGCCIYRENLTSSKLFIKTADRTESIFESDVSGAAPISESGGYLVVSGGKVDKNNCFVYSDMKTDMHTSAVFAALRNVVEIASVDNTISILTADGNVYELLSIENNDGKWLPVSVKNPKHKNCVSLTDVTRVPFISTNYDNAEQAALSGNKKQAAIITKDGKCAVFKSGGFIYSSKDNKITVGGRI